MDIIGEVSMKIMLEDGAIEPVRAHAEDAGLDIFSKEDATLFCGNTHVFHTGVHVQIPKGYCGLLVSKSGLNVNKSMLSTGLIDEGYQGEIVIKLYNHGHHIHYIKYGDKISQLVLIPCLKPTLEIVESFDEETERGEDGFGSTGR